MQAGLLGLAVEQTRSFSRFSHEGEPSSTPVRGFREVQSELFLLRVAPFPSPAAVLSSRDIEACPPHGTPFSLSMLRDVLGWPPSRKGEQTHSRQAVYIIGRV